jgi:mRNA-degrading endonuclease YafQ of YafQ-DinJ toxin-antitoxin module
MTTKFAVRTTSQFDRSLRKLSSRHAELGDLYDEVLNILASDPHNRSGTHSIRRG